MTTNIAHRITSLERWGMRVHADFQAESVACVRDAGFTGVLVNGGSGIGPDMLTPESLVASPVIPDLMPLTIKGNSAEMTRRCELLKAGGIKPWLCLWGIPGPDESANGFARESNRYFDRRSKLEMSAKLQRSPELFGYRNPAALSWRGSRPLCASHPLVREYYQDLFPRLIQTYPDIEGIFFFPGDSDAELCDDHCPRCRATGLDPWGVIVRYVNEISSSVRAVKPDFKFYFTVWNQDGLSGPATIRGMLDNLDPGIDICMSITDNYTQHRKSGPMIFNQPWVMFAQPGDLFLQTADTAYRQGRSIMVLGEISQAEVWDPVCHNLPNPSKVLDLLRNSDNVPGVDAICDFWGHRGPFIAHANHAAMAQYFAGSSGSPEEHLRLAAGIHYGVSSQALIDDALTCWRLFDTVVDEWALNLWPQRFSYAIGRDAARGFLYRALIPQNLRAMDQSWACRTLQTLDIDVGEFAKYQEEDRSAFVGMSAAFDRFADKMEALSLPSCAIARREARNIELAGEMIGSIGRTFSAYMAYKECDGKRLRTVVEAEIDARERQLQISGRIGWGAGVNPLLVTEDIQNMRLFLSRDDFPNPPDECFHFTETPYSV